MLQHGQRYCSRFGWHLTTDFTLVSTSMLLLLVLPSHLFLYSQTLQYSRAKRARSETIALDIAIHAAINMSQPIVDGPLRTRSCPLLNPQACA